LKVSKYPNGNSLDGKSSQQLRKSKDVLSNIGGT